MEKTTLHHFVWDSTKPHIRTIGISGRPGGKDHLISGEISVEDADRLCLAWNCLDELAGALADLYNIKVAGAITSREGVKQIEDRAVKILRKARGLPEAEMVEFDPEEATND